MAKPSVILGEGSSSSIRVEYLKSRRSLRLAAVQAGDVQLVPPIEVPLAEIVSRLALGPGDTWGQPLYLIVAGPDVGARLAIFVTRDEAQKEFVKLRLRGLPRIEWAELSEISGSGRRKVLCFFEDMHGPPSLEHDAASPVAEQPPKAKRATQPAAHE